MKESQTWNNLKLASENCANEARDYMFFTSSNTSISIVIAMKFVRAAFTLGAIWEKNRITKINELRTYLEQKR